MDARNLKQTPGMTGLCLSGQYLYGIGFGTLTIFDVSRPLEPRAVGRLSGLGGGRQLALADTTLYITARERGLLVVDVSDVTNPIVVERFDTVELATGVACAGPWVFVAQRLYGIETLKRGKAGRLQSVAICPTDEAQSVVTDGVCCYVGDWRSGKVRVFEIQPTGELKAQAAYSLDGFGDGLCLSGRYCYAATGHHRQTGPEEERFGNGHGMEIIDMEAGNHVSRVQFPCWPHLLNDYWTVRGDDATAYVADMHNGLFVVDVRDKQHPAVKERLLLPVRDFGVDGATGEQRLYPDCVSSVAMNEQAVYISGCKTGLWVIKRQEQSVKAPEVTEQKQVIVPVKTKAPAARYQLRQAAVTGERIFVAASRSGLLEYNSKCKVEKKWSDACVYDVKVAAGRLWVAEDLDWLAVYDLTNGRCLTRYQSAGQPIYHVHLTRDGRFAFVSGGTGLVTALNVMNLKDIQPVFKYSCGQIQYGDYFPEHDLHGLMPNNWHWNGVAWYDVSGDQPVLNCHAKGCKVTTQIDGIGIFQDDFIMPAWDRQGFWQGHDPQNLTLIPCDVQPWGVPSWDGGTRVYCSCRRSGIIQCFDFSNVLKPKLVQTWELKATPGRVVFLPDGTPVVPAGIRGLVRLS